MRSFPSLTSCFLLLATSTLAGEHRIVPSPDGTQLVFMAQSPATDDDWELFAMAVDGRDGRRLTFHPGWDGYAVWSPDGGRLVFDRGDLDDRKQPFVLDLADGKARPLGTFEGWVSISDWAPDGSHWLGFQEREGGGRDLVRVMPDGRLDAVGTRTPDENEHDAHYSPDGRRIVYASGPTTGEGSWLGLLDVATGKRSRLVESEDRIYGPTWSPDGTRVAYTDAPDGENADIYVVTVATRAIERLTDDPAWDHMPMWRPDGGAIYFSAYREEHEHLYVLDPETGAVHRLWAEVAVSR